MKTLTDILLIAVVMVNIIDISGVTNSIKNALGRWLNRKPESITLKPFDCSYCSTWWVGLAYLIVTGQCTLVTIAYLLLVCALTPVIADLIWALKDFIGIIPNLISRFNNRMYK